MLIGGGGHCKACIDVIEQTEKFEIVGIFDLPHTLNTTVLDYKVIGTDLDIPEYVKLGYSFIITVGQIKNASLRKKIFDSLKENKAKIATVIAKSAYVSPHANVGLGTIVMYGVTINAGATIGENCILNTRCNIEHDAVIGNNVHVSTHAVINGDVEIGDESFIGSNATVSSQVEVVKNTIIGAGTLVAKHISESGTYVGNPAKKIN